MRFTRSIIILMFAFLFSACGSGGILNLNPQPTGDITLTNVTSGMVLSTTLANPLIVTGGAFSIGVTEDHFSGPYTVTISTWTAPFNLSCFVPHYIDQTDKTNVVKFTADNAAPVTTPTQPSPCNKWITASGATQTDEETAQINDSKGHAVTLYYKLAGATAAPGGGGSTASVATGLAVSWSGTQPTPTACGAYVLNVGAVNASGTAVPTTAANPITLSTTGGGYMGFSTATSASALRQQPANIGRRKPNDAAFACVGSPPVGSPGGTSTLQLSTTPNQVLVYFNGFGAAPVTTITASSVGLAPVTIAVSASVAAAAATLVTSWSGPSPTGTECGVYVLNVSAKDASGGAIGTGSTNPITLSTTGGGYMGFSAASAASAAFTCPPQSTGVPPLGPPGGSATLNLTGSPAQVLVYFNGFNAAELTTITASAVGATPATTLVTSGQSNIVASIQLAWNGATPLAANCGAFNLNVQAFDANHKLIVSSIYSNPITLSTDSAGWSGFSTVVAGISPAPPPAALNCLVPVPDGVGFPTLAVPDTATPTIVYYDGPFDRLGAPTRVTASAQGVAVQSIMISFP